ncbi:MAG: hypothetical protein IPP74_00240 [Alphaproteobacteria bacterium]|nr:hypothetical protein [Alphaproteobacteria bacterium]
MESIILNDMEGFKENLSEKTIRMHDVLGLTPLHLLVLNPSKQHLQMIKLALEFDDLPLMKPLSSHYTYEEILDYKHHEQYLAINEYLPQAYLIWNLLSKSNGTIPQKGDNLISLADQVASGENEEAKEIQELLVSYAGKHASKH